MIFTILGWMIFGLFMLAFLLCLIGEMIGHDNVREFLFWVRGRSSKTGLPTRRFPLP